GALPSAFATVGRCAPTGASAGAARAHGAGSVSATARIAATPHATQFVRFAIPASSASACESPHPEHTVARGLALSVLPPSCFTPVAGSPHVKAATPHLTLTSTLMLWE